MKNEILKRFITAILISLISFFFIVLGNYFLILFLLITLSISIFEWKSLASNIYILIIGFFYLIFSFSTFYLLRDINLSFLIFTLLISIFSDIGGYIIGKLFKGPKLTKISPNKTYSGMIGSYFFSFLIGFIYIKFFDIYNFQLHVVFIVFYIFLIASINQLGDLLISYFKRLKKANDTGNLLPGHGGLLDRIDGMIFSIPSSYLFYMISI